MKELPSLELVKEYLDYNKDNGLFVWKKKLSRKVLIGAVAGTTNSHGYIIITMNRCLHRAHRLAWLWCYDAHPELDIDHINTIRNDNRISNLRLATDSQNQWNSVKSSNNTSGYKGTSWNKQKNKWQAQITLNNKNIHLGYFETKEEAYAMYCEAAIKNRGEFARV